MWSDLDTHHYQDRVVRLAIDKVAEAIDAAFIHRWYELGISFREEWWWPGIHDGVTRRGPLASAPNPGCVHGVGYEWDAPEGRCGSAVIYEGGWMDVDFDVDGAMVAWLVDLDVESDCVAALDVAMTASSSGHQASPFGIVTRW